MALESDYALCTRCGEKTFYDAEVDYLVWSFGAMFVLCTCCISAGAALRIEEPPRHLVGPRAAHEA